MSLLTSKMAQSGVFAKLISDQSVGSGDSVPFENFQDLVFNHKNQGRFAGPRDVIKVPLPNDENTYNPDYIGEIGDIMKGPLFGRSI